MGAPGDTQTRMGTLGDTQTGDGDTWGHTDCTWGHLRTPRQGVGSPGDIQTRMGTLGDIQTGSWGHLGTHRPDRGTFGDTQTGYGDIWGHPDRAMGSRGDTQTGYGDTWGHPKQTWGHMGTGTRAMPWGCPGTPGVSPRVSPPKPHPRPLEASGCHPGSPLGAGGDPKVLASLSPLPTSPEVLHLGWDPSPTPGAGGPPGTGGDTRG